jgi:hypothetical protein
MRDFIKEAKGKFSFFNCMDCDDNPGADLGEDDPHVITSVGNEGYFDPQTLKHSPSLSQHGCSLSTVCVFAS